MEKRELEGNFKQLYLSKSRKWWFSIFHRPTKVSFNIDDGVNLTSISIYAYFSSTFWRLYNYFALTTIYDGSY